MFQRSEVLHVHHDALFVGKYRAKELISL